VKLQAGQTEPFTSHNLLQLKESGCTWQPEARRFCTSDVFNLDAELEHELSLQPDNCIHFMEGFKMAMNDLDMLQAACKPLLDSQVRRPQRGPEHAHPPACLTNVCHLSSRYITDAHTQISNACRVLRQR
jgi:hypothetical protein